MQLRLTSLLLATLLAGEAQAAERPTERSKQKAAAETARSEAQEKLALLRRQIEQNEVIKSHAADALAHSEAAISVANRSLRELAGEQTDTERRLQQLAQQQAALEATVAGQQKQLARLLREQHVAGSEDRIKLLLSGDNPNRINRDLQYLGYVSQAQARLLASLRENLAAVQANQDATRNAKQELDEIAQEARSQKALLESEKGRRATLLTQISGRLASQRKEVGTIQRDEQRLAGLVEKLARLIEEQQKAEALERERQREIQRESQRKAAELRKQKEQERRTALAKNAPAKGETPKPAKPDVEDAPAKSFARNELTPDVEVQAAAFGKLRGKLRLPVKGELTAKFGGKRGEGPAWKGIFIRADEGAEIKAVAAGQVVFADWLRGFGNLLIVDHGGAYMTIYGNNHAVLKHAGDAVKAGDVIASAGNSGGNAQSGLYFEMRHQGRAFDPLDWVLLK